MVLLWEDATLNNSQSVNITGLVPRVIRLLCIDCNDSNGSFVRCSRSHVECISSHLDQGLRTEYMFRTMVCTSRQCCIN